MADSKVASAATALEPMRKPGRPTGSGGIETETVVDFGIVDALDALIDIAPSPPQDVGTGMQVATRCQD